MPRTPLPGLDELLHEQLSVATRAQLLRLGLTGNALQHRLRHGGPWQVVLPGTYLTVSGVPSVAQKEMAALLYAGPGSLLTGPIARMHYSLRGIPSSELIDVLIPAERRRRSTSFVRVHRTTRMPERIMSSGPLRLALTARAVADTARLLDEIRDVRAVVADSVQRGRCTISQLAAELTDGPVRGSAAFRSVLAEVSEGIRSTAEGDLRDVIRSARLPAPLFNASLYDGAVFIARPDAWWPEAGVACEVDSRAWHLSPADWERTMSRHDRMAAVGIILLHFSPAELRRSPAQAATLLRGALARGLTRPKLPIRTVPLSSRHVSAPMDGTSSWPGP